MCSQVIGFQSSINRSFGVVYFIMGNKGSKKTEPKPPKADEDEGVKVKHAEDEHSEPPQDKVYYRPKN